MFLVVTNSKQPHTLDGYRTYSLFYISKFIDVWCHHMKIAVLAFVFSVILTTSVPSVLADPILPPLATGTQYRVAFVTSSTTDATSTSIADYDAFVTGVANTQPLLQGLGTNWSAIAAADADPSARVNTSTTGDGLPIYLLDGTVNQLANNYADLWDGSIDRTLTIDERGEVLTGVNVWTGSPQDGGGGHGRGLGTTDPLSGSNTETSAAWTSVAFTPNTELHNMYAISGPLTAGTAVPEPSAFLCLGLIGLGLGGWKKLKKLHTN